MADELVEKVALAWNDTSGCKCAKCLERAAKAIAAYTAALAEPIETAPNEMKVLLWHPGSKYQERGWVIGYMTSMITSRVPVFGCTVFGVGDATHWRPLPADPSARPEGAE